MLVEVSSVEQPTTGSVGSLAVSSATPVVLSLQLDDDERLHHASLVVRPSVAAVAVMQPELATSANGSLANISWLIGRWAQPRELRGLSLAFASKPNPLVVRVYVARGSGGWSLPAGPHTFTMGAAMQLNVSFPGAVADRVLVELLDSSNAPTTVSLGASEPLIVELGNAPRDLALAVQGRRPFLRWNGSIPEGSGFVVDDLLLRLDNELRGEIGSTVVLELRSEVGGELELEWSLGSLRIVDRFHSGTGEGTVSIPWSGVVDEPILVDQDPETSIVALEVSVAATPVAERLVLGSATDPPTPHGQLVRPLYDAAQLIELQAAWALTGIDVFARASGGATSVVLGLHPNDEARPAAAPIVELTRTIESPTPEPTWLSFDLASPISVPAGRWWVVLRADEGELVWLTTTSPVAGSLLCRRDRGPWLSRAPLGSMPPSGLLRVRAASVPPQQPVSLEALGTDSDGQLVLQVPLTLTDDGRARWSAGATPPQAVRSLSLRARAEVATTVVLSNLELRHRPSAS